MYTGDTVCFLSTGETFTMAELALFKRRYENGYDLKTDSRYNQWLSKFHTDGQ